MNFGPIIVKPLFMIALNVHSIVSGEFSKHLPWFFHSNWGILFENAWHHFTSSGFEGEREIESIWGKMACFETLVFHHFINMFGVSLELYFTHAFRFSSLFFFCQAMSGLWQYLMLNQSCTIGWQFVPRIMALCPFIRVLKSSLRLKMKMTTCHSLKRSFTMLQWLKGAPVGRKLFNCTPLIVMSIQWTESHIELSPGILKDFSLLIVQMVRDVYFFYVRDIFSSSFSLEKLLFESFSFV